MKITDLGLASIPPPLCHFEIKLSSVPSAFSVNDVNGQIAIISSDATKLSLCKYIF